MPSTKRLNSADFIKLHIEGLSRQQIADKMHCDRSTVGYHLNTPRAKKMLERYPNIPKPKYGRPTANTPEHEVETLDAIDARRRWIRYYSARIEKIENRMRSHPPHSPKHEACKNQLDGYNMLMQVIKQDLSELKFKLDDYRKNGEPKGYFRDRSRRRQTPSVMSRLICRKEPATLLPVHREECHATDPLQGDVDR